MFSGFKFIAYLPQLAPSFESPTLNFTAARLFYGFYFTFLAEKFGLNLSFYEPKTAKIAKNLKAKNV
ncbi:hypothetical protein [uncultured Campylobacter sp.]|uniref:hypothetical protein n=1 Tax=uncultured Campylobacter sp. TaxID=218934 RepID=UPI0028EC7ECE|nr:hypothetical protein [uncultured Campylobacter sp.]